MPLVLYGAGGEPLEVDTKHRAMRASLRPLDVGVHGAYRAAGLSGAIAATLAANSPLFAFRWAQSTYKAFITEIQIGVALGSTVTTGVPLQFEAIKATAWSAADTGGSALGAPSKMEGDQAASGVGDLRIASTAMLTAGTRTLDAQPFASIVGMSGTTVGLTTPVPKASIYRPIPGVDHPLAFGLNEGFIIRNGLVGPATGSLYLSVDVSWIETDSLDDQLL